MAQPFVGQIIPVAFNFAPSGWFPCDGRLVSISEYEVLYTLIGTTYGGDGQVNFALPNLNGRAPLTAGQGAGLSPYVQGQTGGAESVTLTNNQLGGHNHTLAATSKIATTNSPGPTMVLAATADASFDIYGPAVTGVAMAAAIGSAGGSGSHENRQPFMVVNYIIAWAGVFPSQG